MNLFSKGEKADKTTSIEIINMYDNRTNPRQNPYKKQYKILGDYL